MIFQSKTLNAKKRSEKALETQVMKEISDKTKYLWLGKFKGFGTATFPKTVMPVLLADAHLQQLFKIKNKTNKHTKREVIGTWIVETKRA